jgi:riboflavin synthase
MFTGVIEGLGSVSRISSTGQGKRLAITPEYKLDHTKIGDSIAVNGACLTVVKMDGKRFEVDVSPETVAKTTFGGIKIGERVNLERAMRFSDRIDGHLVSGHIDGTGTIIKHQTLDNVTIVSFRVPPSIARYLIKKGSVAVDGISLTINTCAQDEFSVSIIPLTGKVTTITFKRSGDPVNIEADMIGKYVERFILASPSGASEKQSERSGIDMDFLAKTGFI